MTIVHFATELSGGAGDFAKNVHLTMHGMGHPSLMLTRDRHVSTPATASLKPMSRVEATSRARWLTLLRALGLVDTSYAMFGVERAPVKVADVHDALQRRTPTAFVFYWISYFIDFEAIYGLRQMFPQVPIALVCLDEALLTGGCHYSHGCLGYQASCSNCPATGMKSMQRRIEQGLAKRQAVMKAIDPIVFYPTTNMLRMGGMSAAMKHARSVVMPLGAIFEMERAVVPAEARAGTLKLLIRSSGEHRKGCDLFASAIGILGSLVPDLRARMQVISIGDGTLSQAGIDRHVDHVDRGYVTRDELMALYRDLDVLMVSSREDAGPLMINECVALGIFVIATPIGVAGDLIVEGRNGLLTKEISVEAMANAMMAMLQRPEMVRSAKDALGERQDLQARSAALTFEGYVRAMMNQLSIPV